jgi:hypothetical protein
MRGKTVVALMAVSAVVLFAVAAANAGGNVTIGVRLRLRSQPDDRPLCQVSVPVRSNGIVALEAAVAATKRHEPNCTVHGFTFDSYGNTHSVVCINSACDVPNVAWNQYENAAWEGYLEDFSANAGDALVFVYQFSPTGFPFYG